METRASYFLVGLFVLNLMAGLVVVSLWLVKYNQVQLTYYYIYFTSSVTGLQEGSAVRLRGVPVGSVTSIGIDDKDPSLTEVVIGLKPGVPIKTDTRASIQPQGITGLVFVQLTGASREAPLLQPAPGKRRGVIPSDPSPVDALLSGAPQLVGQAQIIAERLIAFLNEDNQNNLGRIVANLATASGQLAASENGVGKLLSDSGETLATLRSAAAALDGLARDLRTATADLAGTTSRVASGTEAAIEDLRKTARSVERLAGGLERLANEAREPVLDFAQTGLYELVQFMTEARTLMQRLSRISIQFERDPARFLFGDQNRGVEAR